MSQVSRKVWANFSRCGAALALGLTLAGCNRDQVKVQEVPKEADPAMPQLADAGGAPAAMPANPHAGMDMSGGMAQPQVKWTLPDGWKEKAPGQMEVGSFTATDKSGHTADVSIIPLPTGGSEMELTIYNM